MRPSLQATRRQHPIAHRQRPSTQRVVRANQEVAKSSNQLKFLNRAICRVCSLMQFAWRVKVAARVVLSICCASSLVQFAAHALSCNLLCTFSRASCPACLLSCILMRGLRLARFLPEPFAMFLGTNCLCATVKTLSVGLSNSPSKGRCIPTPQPKAIFVMARAVLETWNTGVQLWELRSSFLLVVQTSPTCRGCFPKSERFPYAARRACDP